MKDGILAGTGNSRFLRSVEDFKDRYPSYESFANALVDGNLPVDLNGINPDGWEQTGTPLNKRTLLSEEVVELLGLSGEPTVSDALKKLAMPKGELRVELGSYVGNGKTDKVTISSTLRIACVVLSRGATADMSPDSVTSAVTLVRDAPSFFVTTVAGNNAVAKKRNSLTWGDSEVSWSPATSGANEMTMFNRNGETYRYVVIGGNYEAIEPDDPSKEVVDDVARAGVESLEIRASALETRVSGLEKRGGTVDAVARAGVEKLNDAVYIKGEERIDSTYVAKRQIKPDGTITTTTRAYMFYADVSGKGRVRIKSSLATMTAECVGVGFYNVPKSEFVVSMAGADTVVLLGRTLQPTDTPGSFDEVFDLPRDAKTVCVMMGTNTKPEIVAETSVERYVPKTEIPIYSMSMYQKWACCGASWSSGYVYTDSGVAEKTSLSWGANLARRMGNEFRNFSRHSMNTRDWQTNAHCLPALLSADPCDLYIISLGGNDTSLGTTYIGTVADIGTDADTFYGNYAKIISQIQTHAPNAHIICDMWYDSRQHNTTRKAFSDAVSAIAEYFHLPRTNWADDEWFGSPEFMTGLVGDHPTAVQLSAMAYVWERIYSRCVEENYGYFKGYGGGTT